MTAFEIVFGSEVEYEWGVRDQENDLSSSGLFWNRPANLRTSCMKNGLILRM